MTTKMTKVVLICYQKRMKKTVKRRCQLMDPTLRNQALMRPNKWGHSVKEFPMVRD